LAIGVKLGPSLGQQKVRASGVPVSISPRLSFSQTGPLKVAIRSICEQLSGGGWHDLLLQIANNDLNITSPELLSRLLQSIDRNVPGMDSQER
jgi:hypothetical protein